MPKVAVVLSGCGVYDGAEIHESVITLLALDRAGAEVTIAAPDIEQAHVINHVTGEPVQDETRRVAVEAARIARGPVVHLDQVHASDVDAVIFPGGFGAAKNLSSLAFDGDDMTVEPQVARLIRETAAANKPIGLLCITPAMAVKVLVEAGLKPTVTVGTDEATASGIERLGGRHQPCQATEIVVDEANKLVSSPAYMLPVSIKEIATGIEKMVSAVLELCG